MSTIEEKIAQMYDSQLAAQKEQLGANYNKAQSALDAQKQNNRQLADANLNRTAVEAQKAAVTQAELHNAYGLSSGARAQARLSQENQAQADMTAIRAAHQAADAETERQRTLLAQDYAAAIRQAQAENDIAKAQALYENARAEEQKLLAKQEAAAGLMAENAGDFSLYKEIYGLTDAQIAALNGTAAPKPTPGANSSGNDSATMPTDTTPSGPITTPQQAEAVIRDILAPKPALPAEPALPSEPAVDMNSVSALGFGPLTEEALAQLVAAGLVEEYEEDGYIKFRRQSRPSLGFAPGAGLRP